jgi:DnaJ-class molecular chaperone
MIKLQIQTEGTVSLDITVELDHDCWQCSGGGLVYSGKKKEPTPCDICRGKGGWLTENGEAIVELIKKYGGSK